MSACDVCSSAGGLMLPWVIDNKTQIACMACRARYPQASDVVDWAARYNIAVAELICFRAERDAAVGERDRLAAGWDEHIGAFKDEILDTRRIAEEALDAWESLWESLWTNKPPPAAIEKLRQQLSELRGDYPDSAAVIARAKGG